MADNTKMSRYVLKQILANEPVCVVWSVKNGIHADALEEAGVWKPCIGNTANNTSWIVKHPLSIILSDHKRYDLKAGDMFTLE